MGIRSRWLESWSPEIAASCVSLASITALVGFLLGMQDRKVFYWHAITPNTVVAILATLARLSNGIVVSSSLGQFKWIQHHRRPAPLTEFVLTTGASTGPWDSLWLIIRTRSMALVAIGCWIVILMLPFDAFAQQIVQFETTMLFHNDSSQALIPRAESWNGGSYTTVNLMLTTENGTTPLKSFGNMILDFGMQAAILSGLSTEKQQLLQQLPASCASSDCLWRDYESLAACSICSDVTHMMQKRHFEAMPMAMYAPLEGQMLKGNLTEWYLPNGLTINNADTLLTLNERPVPTTVLTTQAMFDSARTLTLRNLTTMPVSMTSLSAPPLVSSSGYSDWPNTSIRAQECGLYLCIKQLNTAFINGTMTQEEDIIAANRTPDSYQWVDDLPVRSNWSTQTALFNDSFWYSRTDLKIVRPDNIASQTPLASVNITQDAIDSLIWRLNQTFRVEDGLDDNLGQSDRMTGIIITDTRVEKLHQPSYLYQPASMQGIWSPAHTANFAQLEPRFEALATSMTNSMRTSSNDLVRGEEGILITILAVRWAWLTLPLACVLLGAVFLLIAIVETKRTRTPLWKADATALLFHSLEKVPSSDVWDMSRLTQMEKVAEETVVRLTDTNGKGFFLEPVAAEIVMDTTSTAALVNNAYHSIPRKPVPVRRPSSRSLSPSTAVETREPSEQSSLMIRSEAL